MWDMIDKYGDPNYCVLANLWTDCISYILPNILISFRPLTTLASKSRHYIRDIPLLDFVLQCPLRDQEIHEVSLRLALSAFAYTVTIAVWLSEAIARTLSLHHQNAVVGPRR